MLLEIEQRMLKIRLARRGTHKRPFYHIVVANASAPRDGKFIEKLGFYDPLVSKDHAQRLKLNGDRAAHWLSCGAQPTDRVLGFLADAGLCEKKPRHNPIKGRPGKKAQEALEAAAL